MVLVSRSGLAIILGLIEGLGRRTSHKKPRVITHATTSAKKPDNYLASLVTQNNGLLEPKVVGSCGK